MDQQAIEQQLSLLATYRRTVAHLRQQAAQYGGESFAPPQVANGIYEARENISQIKEALRTNGVDVDDHPDDQPPTIRATARAFVNFPRFSRSIGALLLLVLMVVGLTLVLNAIRKSTMTTVSTSNPSTITSSGSLSTGIQTNSPASTSEPTKAPIILPPTAVLNPTTDIEQITTPMMTVTALDPSPSLITSQSVTLYFADTTGTLLVPVQRSIRVENNHLEETMVQELIIGARNGLQRLIPADVNLLNLTTHDGTTIVNFDRDPGSEKAYTSIIFTLTDLPNISRIQIQVNGQNVGGIRGRSVLNPINPAGLPYDPSTTEYLPLYFPSVDGLHDVRLIRMVPRTRQLAEATVRALLEGPGPYGNAVTKVIPEGTELRGIKVSNGVVLIDFTKPFAQASDAAIRTITESLTTFATVRGVQYLVEGQPYREGTIFSRPPINPE